ncbi:hypothetical protein COU20_02440 [Candidatus Kaiserbacteria bacterium CG10_big_fil_rev_8_21_14_0_10_59_10]|uniref:Uncharacterized protein n=1 Tax=Candidatus Kaiserbacteria bacterium CG10_big_fil_rev_8_21_14_0_10_59_10 TaxID=1974612 RepID=A0A2H0U7N8_9BACT|nr:MAG: hypothetical protein COU20_02440 [Candidatus Kaiserbacteria bacterium CG10_big_fil_rev_8_21_14_0_10_59_10]
MTLDALVIVSGVLVAALPFLAFPASWKSVMFPLLGVFIILLGVALRRKGSAGHGQRERTAAGMDGMESTNVAPHGGIE